jgi:DNA invertase Pin-like site-specific DNA recombinase
MSRLDRSTRDLLNTIHAITEKNAGFKSLADTWADTTTSHGKLMTVLGVSPNSNVTSSVPGPEGRVRAMGTGVKFGRKPKLTPHQAKEAIRRSDQAARERFGAM